MNDGRRWINKQFGVLFDSSTLQSCRTYLADHWWMNIRTGSIRTSHGCCYKPPTFVLLQQRPRRITGDNYCIAKGDPIYWIETAGIWIHLTFDPSTLAITYLNFEGCLQSEAPMKTKWNWSIITLHHLNTSVGKIGSLTCLTSFYRQERNMMPKYDAEINDSNSTKVLTDFGHCQWLRLIYPILSE